MKQFIITFLAVIIGILLTALLQLWTGFPFFGKDED
jgi:hypothetical protein